MTLSNKVKDVGHFNFFQGELPPTIMNSKRKIFGAEKIVKQDRDKTGKLAKIRADENEWLLKINPEYVKSSEKGFNLFEPAESLIIPQLEAFAAEIYGFLLGMHRVAKTRCVVSNQHALASASKVIKSMKVFDHRSKKFSLKEMLKMRWAENCAADFLCLNNDGKNDIGIKKGEVVVYDFNRVFYPLIQNEIPDINEHIKQKICPRPEHMLPICEKSIVNFPNAEGDLPHYWITKPDLLKQFNFTIDELTANENFHYQINLIFTMATLLNKDRLTKMAEPHFIDEELKNKAIDLMFQRISQLTNTLKNCLPYQSFLSHNPKIWHDVANRVASYNAYFQKRNPERLISLTETSQHFIGLTKYMNEKTIPFAEQNDKTAMAKKHNSFTAFFAVIFRIIVALVAKKTKELCKENPYVSLPPKKINCVELQKQFEKSFPREKNVGKSIHSGGLNVKKQETPQLQQDSSQNRTVKLLKS